MTIFLQQISKHDKLSVAKNITIKISRRLSGHQLFHLYLRKFRHKMKQMFLFSLFSLQSQKNWNLPRQHAHKQTRSLWQMTQFWRRAQCSSAMMTSMTRMQWALLITTTYVIHRPLGKLSQAQQIRNILDSLRRLSQCCRVTYIPHNQGHI